MPVHPVTEDDVGTWLTLRQALWPDTDDVRHEEDVAAILANRFQKTAFVYRGDDGEPLGFAEVSLRRQVDGCRTSPVGYLEGLYVAPAFRRQGVATKLVTAAEEWVRQRGCNEFATDTDIENAEAQQFHRTAGFQAVEKIVIFAKPVVPAKETQKIPALALSDAPHSSTVAAITRDSGLSGWTIFHILVGLVGVVCIIYSDISSPAPWDGAILPVLAVLCVIYVGAVLVARRYRSRTDERDRGVDLFSSDGDDSS